MKAKKGFRKESVSTCKPRNDVEKRGLGRWRKKEHAHFGVKGMERSRVRQQQYI